MISKGTRNNSPIPEALGMSELGKMSDFQTRCRSKNNSPNVEAKRIRKLIVGK
jgi:hypothetical protein